MKNFAPLFPLVLPPTVVVISRCQLPLVNPAAVGAVPTVQIESGPPVVDAGVVGKVTELSKFRQRKVVPAVSTPSANT